MPGYLKILFAALWLTLPLSVEIPIGYGAQITAPAEILIAILGLALFRELPLTLLKGQAKTLAIPAIWLLWGWLCAFFSTMPVVSIKYMLVTTAYCWVFFVPVVCWPKVPWRQWLTYFAVGMGVVVVCTLFRHGVYFSFRVDQANLAPMPFFDDHTIYGAVLAMILFSIIALAEPFRGNEYFSNKTALDLLRWRRSSETATSLLILLLVTGLLSSTSRGALISVATAIGWLFFVQNKRLTLILGALTIAGIFIFFPKTGVATYLQKDVSTAERFNRYDAAQRMAQQHPIMGFGPGAFQFQYIPFQQPEKMTRISLSSPLSERNPANFGRGGGAHSEYFRALAETGWPGLLLTLLLGAVPFWHGLWCDNKVIRWRLWTSAGLVTFFIHGLLNDFFHDPRIAALVWILMGILGRNCDPNASSTSN